MKKKFLALVMTLSMVLSLVPMTALATGDGEPTEQPTTTAENQAVGADANEGKQDSNSNADSSSTTTGGGGGSDTSKDSNTNPENKDENQNDEPGSTGDPSKPEDGGTGTEPTEPEKPEVPKYAAKIGETKYETLDAAIEAAGDGATIELLQDVTATKTFSKSLTFTGGHAINFNVYGWRYKGALVLDGAHLNIINDASSQPANNDEVGRWFTMCLAGSITAKNEAGISFVIDSDSGATCAIYMDEHARAMINVESGSRFSITGKNTKGIVGKGIELGNTENAEIHVIGHSEFLIDGTNRGYVNSPEIKVEDSTFTVKNCTASASNGGKFVAINSDVNFIDNAGHGLSASTLTSENSNFNCSGNAYYGIAVAGDLSVDGESNITANENGTGFTGGGLRLGTSKTIGKMNGTISEGATLTLNENSRNALENYGNLTIQSGVVTEILKNNEPQKSGGGIYNGGTLTLPSDAKIYNNHAQNAGDDIYNTGTITFGAVGNDWILDECTPEHPILGWYKDGMESNEDKSLKRWNGHGEAYYAVEYTAPATEVTEALALKAAHPKMYSVTYRVSGEIPAEYEAPAQKYYKDPFKYTVENVPSSIPGTKDGVNGTYSFTGWQTKNGDIVTGQQTLKEDTTLYGKWTFTKKSSSGGHRPSNPPVTIPDDVPTGLDLKNHYGYIIGYPVDYYTGKPTTDQTKKPVRPEGKITRAEVATIYFRMLTDENRAANWNQVSGFSDVKRSAWYNNAISTLTKAGILKGYEDGTFQPNGYITRAEFATIAIRFFSGVYEGEDLFPDIKGHWAEDYINNAANKGLVKGYEDGTFGPDRYITRAEAVTLVNRTLNRHPHNDGLHKDMLVWPDNMDTSKWYYADMQEATNSHEPDKNQSTADKEYWGKMLPIRDWEALEKEWSNANSAPGEGEVV